MSGSCSVLRHVLVRTGYLDLNGGRMREDVSRAWHIQPCDVPLFGDRRDLGVCRSCAADWSTPENHPAADCPGADCPAVVAAAAARAALELAAAGAAPPALLFHATVVTRRGGRRINSAVGERRQLCGAAPTDRDMVPSVFRLSLEQAWASPVGAVPCPSCSAQVTAMRPRVVADRPRRWRRSGGSR